METTLPRRKMSDCRLMPSQSNCSLVVSGEENEVVRAAVEHAVSVHQETDSPELREAIRRSLVDEPPALARPSRRAA